LTSGVRDADAEMTFRVGVDIGGTFIDIVLRLATSRT
jgi:pantothenate kinase